MLIKHKLLILLTLLMFLPNNCIVEYTPLTHEEAELLNVEGLITDQPGVNIIKLSKSISIWNKQVAKPLKQCIVTISDDLGQIYNLIETNNGNYITNPTTFQGVAGRKYTLHIKTTSDPVNYSYSSFPVEMKPVPPIDNIYYEKKTYHDQLPAVEGCQVYLDTQDPSNNCKFFRWEYSETWEIRLPYNVKNRVCWVSNNSNDIFIKNTSVLGEARIIRYPVISISNPIDKLSIKYSILVSQFSLNEDEYLYWERLKNSLEQVGGLYDQVPASIPNNIFCVEDPNRNVLGYFSVSAKTSRRLFIKDSFAGYDHQYENCITDTITGNVIIDTLKGINSFIWMIVDSSDKVPPRRYLTRKRDCGDCMARGTNIKPDFWSDDKK